MLLIDSVVYQKTKKLTNSLSMNSMSGRITKNTGQSQTKPMNEPSKKRSALECLNELVEEYERTIIKATERKHGEALTAHTEALLHCARLKELLTSLPAKPIATSTVWVGLEPPALKRLLVTSEEFSKQYEMRAQNCGVPFTRVDKTPIEFIGTELGLGLGIKLFKLNEGFTELNLSTIILAVEDIKRIFVRGLGMLGIYLEKEWVGVFVQTRVV